jgi:hypothetical protein
LGRSLVLGKGEQALREALRAWGKRERRVIDGVDVAPACAHGLIVENKIADLRDDLDDIKTELEWIRKLIVAAIVTAGVGTLLKMAGFT